MTSISRKKKHTAEITEKSCRLCLKACKDKDVDSFRLAERYLACTGYKIKSTDIPKKICSNCNVNLKRSYNFFNKCKRIEARLELSNFLLPPDFKEDEATIKPEDDDFAVDLALNQVMVKLEPEFDVSGYIEEVAEKHVMSEQPKEDKPKPNIFCDQCGSVFTDNNSFKQHYRHHFMENSNLPKMYCHLCMQKTNQKIGFISKERLTIHMEKHHLRDKPKRPCPHCGKLFNNPNTMRSHVFRQHIDPKDYKFECLVCHKRFFKQHLLKVHQRGHTGEKLYSCHICGAKFSMPQHMRIHIANIHNPTNKTCEFCGKTFTADKYLQQHLLTHNQGCYTCPLCPGKSFSLTTTLRSHMKTNHPNFPLPPPGTKLKNFDWGKMINTAQQIVISSPPIESFVS